MIVRKEVDGGGEEGKDGGFKEENHKTELLVIQNENQSECYKTGEQLMQNSMAAYYGNHQIRRNIILSVRHVRINDRNVLQ